MGNLFCCCFKNKKVNLIEEYIKDNNILKVKDGVKVPYLKNFEISADDYVKHCNFFINIHENDDKSKILKRDRLKYESSFNDF